MLNSSNQSNGKWEKNKTFKSVLRQLILLRQIDDGYTKKSLYT